MNEPSKDILQLPLEKRAEMAFKIAVAKAIDENLRLGIPVYVSHKGKVVKLSAKEVGDSSKSKNGKRSLLRRIDRYGRVVIPAEFRRKLGFTPGTKVLIQLRRGGLVVRRLEKRR